MKKIPKHIIKLVERFEMVFDLGSWDRHFILKKNDEEERAASIEVDEEYQRIYISLYPCFFNNDRVQQREYILHEFCHVISTPLVRLLDEFKVGKLVTFQQIKFESERATSRMTNILDGFLTGGYMNSKRAYAEYLKKPVRKKSKKGKKA